MKFTQEHGGSTNAYVRYSRLRTNSLIKRDHNFPCLHRVLPSPSLFFLTNADHEDAHPVGSPW